MRVAQQGETPPRKIQTIIKRWERKKGERGGKGSLVDIGRADHEKVHWGELVEYAHR